MLFIAKVYRSCVSFTKKINTLCTLFHKTFKTPPNRIIKHFNPAQFKSFKFFTSQVLFFGKKGCMQ